MRRIAEDGIHRAGFDASAPVHDAHPVRVLAKDGKIVGNQQNRQLAFVAQGAQQRQDARLDRHVEGSEGFVGHEDAGSADQGAGEGNALTLPRGKLSREAVEGGVIEANRRQGGRQVRLFGRQPEVAGRLGKGLRHGAAGAEGRGRVLEDQLHQSPRVAVPPVIAVRCRKPHVALADRDQPDQRAGQGALPGTGFSGESVNRSGMQLKIDPTHGLDLGCPGKPTQAPRPVTAVQAIDHEYRGRHESTPRGW